MEPASPFGEMDNASSLPAQFHTTQWSMVLSAAADSGEALERLCRAYWRPLYGYARRAGRSIEDAEDLVQGFLAKMLERHWLRTVQRDGGPFRAFLQMAFKRYLCDDHDRASAQKRGGGAAHVPLDAREAEAFYQSALATADSPETACERAWALEVFERARTALRQECEASGHLAAHDAVHAGEPHAGAAARLGMSTVAFTSLAYRMRRRLQELLRQEILQTVRTAEDFEEEVAAMLRALAAGAP